MVFAQKKNKHFLLEEGCFVVYESRRSNSFISQPYSLTSNNVKSPFGFRFVDFNPDQFCIYNSVGRRVEVYSLQQMMLKFTATSQPGISGKLNFSNNFPDTLDQVLDLGAVFEVPVVKPNSSAANTSEQGFFQRHSAVIIIAVVLLLVAAAGVVYYMVKRAQLRKMKKLANTEVVTSLEEFYYHR